jgi:transcription antitermination protein NusB
MPARRRSRQKALQILFLRDTRHYSVEEAFDSFYHALEPDEGEERPQPDQFTEQLVRGTVDKLEHLDELVGRHSQHWRMERMPIVDRNILRMAAFEMTILSTPPAVVIDEALELARRFSGDESVSFVNGVLDAIRRGRDSGEAETPSA